MTSKELAEVNKVVVQRDNSSLQDGVEAASSAILVV